MLIPFACPFKLGWTLRQVLLYGVEAVEDAYISQQKFDV